MKKIKNSINRRVLFLNKKFRKLFKIFFYLWIFIFLFLLSLSIALSVRKKDFFIGKDDFLKKKISLLINKYISSHQHGVNFGNILVKFDDFNILKRKFFIRIGFDNISYSAGNFEIKTQNAGFVFDLREVSRININDLYGDGINLVLKDTSAKKINDKTIIKDVFVLLYDNFNDLLLNEKNLELLNLNVKVKDRVFFFEKILLKQTFNLETANIILDVLYDKKKSQITSLCDLNKKKCSFEIKNLSTEILDIILQEDTKNKLMNADGAISLNKNGLELLTFNLFLDNTKLYLKLKNNFTFFDTINYHSNNLKFQANNINLSNIQDTFDNLILKFEADNVAKDFNFFVKKIFHYLSRYGIDLRKSKFKGKGEYIKGVFNDDFYISFHDVDILEAKDINGHFIGKDDAGKMNILSCTAKGLLLKNINFLIGMKNVNNFEINFDLDIRNVLKKKFKLDHKNDIYFPLTFQRDGENHNITIENAGDIKLNKSINFDAKDLKLVFGEDNTFKIFSKNVKLDVNFKHGEGYLTGEGFFIKDDIKFDLVVNFNFLNDIFLIKISNNSELFLFEQDTNKIFLKIDSEHLNGIFISHLISRLQLFSSQSNTKDRKIILDLNINNISLIKDRKISDLICKGYIQNFTFSKDFILKFNLVDTDGKSYKNSFNNQDKVINVENAQPLLYAFGRQDIKYCSFRIFKNDQDKYILYVENFQNNTFSIQDSYSDINFRNNRYIEIKNLLVKVLFVYFIFHAVFDIKTKKLETDMRSLSLIK